MNIAKVLAFILTVVTLGSASPQGQTSRAAQEIAQLLEVHRADYLKGDVNAWTAMYAEDAVVDGVAGGRRTLEGREAIREYFMHVMKDFPSRTIIPSNVHIRVYNEDATPTAILNLESNGTRTDASGRPLVMNFRESLVWTKIQGKWLIVNHHVSPHQAPNPVQ